MSVKVTDLLVRIEKELQKGKASFRMYLIEDSEKKVNRFILYRLEIQGEIISEIRTILAEKIKKVNARLLAGEVKSRNFYDLNYSPTDVSSLEIHDVSNLDDTLSKIKVFGTILPLKDLNLITKFHAFAIEIFSNDSQIIYFRKMKNSALLSQSKVIKLFWKGSKFNELKEDILLLDRDVDCIYFENDRSLLILNKGQTEDIFRFSTYYENHSREVLQALSNVVTINNDLKNKILSKKRMIKRITNLSKNQKFSRDIEQYRKIVPFVVNENKRLDKRIEFSIDGNKITVTTETAFNDFLDVCEDNFVQSPATQSTYRAIRKETLK